MATTLVSVLGKGRAVAAAGGRTRYEAARYRFPGAADAADRETTLMGLALLDHLLQEEKAAVRQWVVIGTPASLWSELLEIVPEAQQDEKLLERASDLNGNETTGRVGPADLGFWQRAINERGPAVPVSLHLLDTMRDDAALLRAAEVLFTKVGVADPAERGEDLVLDVTNGLRHQPLVLAFTVLLMRRTHRLGRVRLFYGAYEDKDAQGVTPVVELGACERLMDAAEAAATWQTTGNYAGLAADLGETVEAAARTTWFHESINRLPEAQSAAHRLRKRLSVADEGADPLRRQLAAVLRDAAPRADPNGLRLHDRLRDRARLALQHGDYLRASMLTYEALTWKLITVHAVQPVRREDFSDEQMKQARDAARRNALSAQQRHVYNLVMDLRNLCAHGTGPPGGERTKRCERQEHALASPEAFCEALEAGLTLFNELDS